MLNVYVCDDDKSFVDYYCGTLESLAEKNSVSISISTFFSGEQMLFQLIDNPNQADIIYLDILMGRMNGIQTAKKLRDLGCEAEIIFLTSSDEYVFDAFDIQPLQYLMKGSTSKEKFEEIFLKAVNKKSKKDEELFIWEKGSSIKKIPLSSIYYFEVLNRVTTVYYDKDKSFNFYAALDKLQTSLNNKNFIRIHRSFLINIRQIESISKNIVTLTNGVELPLGSTYAKEVKSEFQKYLFL